MGKVGTYVWEFQPTRVIQCPKSRIVDFVSTVHVGLTGLKLAQKVRSDHSHSCVTGQSASISPRQVIGIHLCSGLLRIIEVDLC